MNTKQSYISVLSVLIIALFLPATIQARPLHLNVKSAILYNYSTGKILYEQDADARIPPASTTKILSLYLVYETLKEGRANAWDKVYISRDSDNTGGSKMNLKAGTHVSLSELMMGMAVASANDACVAVAEHFGGEDEFVRRMNQKARDLGMTSTVFKNPHGLPAEGQYTTARDMLKLARDYLDNFPESLQMHSTKFYTYEGRTCRNVNRLLGTFNGADGIKTGYVNESRYNIVATAKRADTRLIAVVLGSQTSSIRARETAKLLEAGFRMVDPGLAEPPAAIMADRDAGPSKSRSKKQLARQEKEGKSTERAKDTRVASAKEDRGDKRSSSATAERKSSKSASREIKVAENKKDGGKNQASAGSSKDEKKSAKKSTKPRKHARDVRHDRNNFGG